MPYYVFKMFANKKLEYLTEFEQFKQAREYAKAQRKQLTAADNYVIKINCAKNRLEAEVVLKEEREPRPMGDD